MNKYIESEKVKIFLREEVADSKMAVLLIHGLAEHSGRYIDFIQDLKNANISVFSMDLRGHGQSIGTRGDSQSIGKVIKDVDNVLEYIKNNFKFEKIGIFGHSIGGLVASLYASVNQSKVDFLVLSSPAIYCPKKLKVMKFIPYKFIPFIKVKKNYSESKEMLEYSRKDQFALNKFSIRTVGVFFVEGQRNLKKKLNITCPTLLVYGKQDKLLTEQSKFTEFMSRLTNNQNKIIAYENAKHRIVQNQGSKERIEDIINWIKEVL